MKILMQYSPNKMQKSKVAKSRHKFMYQLSDCLVRKEALVQPWSTIFLQLGRSPKSHLQFQLRTMLKTLPTCVTLVA